MLYTPQEETCMNRKVMFNIISEIALLTVIQCAILIHELYIFSSKVYYIIIAITINNATYICNALVLFHFINMVFIVKQRYNHLNKGLTNWINGTVSRAINLQQGNERCIQSNRPVNHVNITCLFVSSVGSSDRTLELSDIHSLRMIYSQLYDITCLINDTYGIPILAAMCWILTIVIYTYVVYVGVTDFNIWGAEAILQVIACSLLLFKVTLFCHRATNEASYSRI
jgi:hypothetical protein